MNSQDVQKIEGIEIQEVKSFDRQDSMMQVKSEYTTAVSVVKPRNLNIVISRCVEEANIAGEEFYYSWRQGGSIIEGITVSGALAIARNWGNSAVQVKVEETFQSYLFYASFIDLETGFNLIRPFRQNKQSPKTKEGKDIYSGERGADIVFQIGASKALRNVILNAVPKWLSDKVLEISKNNVSKDIDKIGLPKAIEAIEKKIKLLGIPQLAVEKEFGKSSTWDNPKLVQLKGILRSIEDKLETPESFFPSLAEPPSEEKPKQPKIRITVQPDAKEEKPTPENADLEKPSKAKAVRNVVEEPVPENSYAYYREGAIRQTSRAELKQFLKNNSAGMSKLSNDEMLELQDFLVELEKGLK